MERLEYFAREETRGGLGGARTPTGMWEVVERCPASGRVRCLAMREERIAKTIAERLNEGAAEEAGGAAT